MRQPLHAILLLSMTSAVGGSPSGPIRFIPTPCEATAPAESDAESAEAAWNRSYTEGFRAVSRGEWNTAEGEFCRSLEAARRFGPRDWRFAETLDELGLVYYSLGEYEASEAMQGAAVAELLLALGPQDPKPPGAADVCDATDLERYIRRLGWVWTRLGREDDIRTLQARPYEIFRRGYLPHDAALADRLEWLVSEYLRRENLEAVTALEAWITGIHDDGGP